MRVLSEIFSVPINLKLCGFLAYDRSQLSIHVVALKAVLVVSWCASMLLMICWPTLKVEIGKGGIRV